MAATSSDMFDIPNDPLDVNGVPVRVETSAVDDHLDKILATTHFFVTDEDLKACQPLLTLHQANEDEKLRKSIRASLNLAKQGNAAYQKRLTETYGRIKSALNVGFKDAGDPDKKQADGSILIKIPVDKKFCSDTYDQPTLQRRREQDDVLADLLDQLKHQLSVKGFVCKESLSSVQPVGARYSGGEVIFLHCTRVKLPSTTKPCTKGSPDETPYY
jgi:hypothetical protein